MIWHFPIPIYLWALAGLLIALLAISKARELILGSWISWAVLSLLFFVGALLLPSQNHLLGDGLTHLGNPTRVFASTEPLDIFVHHLMYQLTGSSLWSYRIVALLAGTFYLIGVTLLIRKTGTALERAIVALAFLATGTIQFYFGYVESYTLLHVFMLYFLIFSLRDLERGQISWLPMLFFVSALLSHFSGIALLPALIYLYYDRLKSKIWWLAAGIVVAGVVVGRTVNLWKIIVPFWPTEYSAYWLLSGDHLLDLLNVLLLSGPAFVLLFWNREFDRRQIMTLLALAGTLGFSVLVDPKIGAFRDWDLISAFAVPLAVLVALRAPRKIWTVAALIAIICLRVVPWLLFNSRSQIEYVKDKVLADMHYSSQYDEGQRLESWGLLLQELGDRAGAEEAFLRRLEIKPDDPNTLNMLAPLQFKMRSYEASYRTYLRLYPLKPDQPLLLFNTAYTAFVAGRTREALTLMRELPREWQEYANFRTLYAGILSREGRHEQAMQALERTELVASEARLPFYLAQSARALGRLDVARALVSSAHNRDSTDTEITALYNELMK